jgi:hypothetical protein
MREERERERRPGRDAERLRDAHGAEGIAVASATPADRNAASPIDSWTPIACPAAANASTDIDQARSVNAIANATVRGSAATARPPRSRDPSDMIVGQRSIRSTTRSAYGRRWATMPTPRPATSSALTASPTRT